jgi:hypothetical protein
MKTYHVSTVGVSALCGEVKSEDVVVPMEEINRSDGRHFNCVACHKVMTNGLKHSRPVS